MTQDDPNESLTVPIAGVARFFGIAVFGLVVLFIMSTLVYSAFHSSFSVTLNGAEWSTGFLANLIVSYFAFRAFKRTKARPWLYVACAAVIFASLALLRALATVMRLRGTPVYWIYIIELVGYIIGVVFYASGIVSLARQASGTMPVGPNPEVSFRRSPE